MNAPAPAHTPPPPTAHRWKLAVGRWPLTAVSFVFTLLLLVSAGLGVVLGSERGLRWALTTAQHLAPTVLSIGQIEGRAMDRLRLTAVAVNLPKLSVRLGVLEWAWNPSALLTGVLAVEQVRVEDLELVLAPSDDSEPLRLPPLLLPLAITVADAQLERMRLLTRDQEQPRFVLEAARLRASQLAGGVLDLGQLQAQLAAPALSVNLSGRATLLDHYPLALDLAWTLHHAPTAHLSGTGQIRGDLQQLDLTQELSGAATGRLTTEVRDLLGDLGWSGRLELTALDLPAWQADLPPAQMQAQLHTEGTLADAQLHGSLEFQLPEAIADSVSTLTLALHWQPTRVTLETFDWREQRSLATAQLTGALDLSQPQPSFTLAGQWNGLRWPLTGAALAESASGNFNASGKLDAFAYQLAAHVAGAQFPPAQLKLSGQGTAHDTRLDSVTVALLDGQLAGAGTVTWAPALAWDLRLDATQLNPGVQFPDWPGRLDAHLTSAGHLSAAGPQLTAELVALSGQLRAHPISASGRVQLAGERWQIERLNAASGSSRLTLDGRVAQALDVAFQLDAPDLAMLWPEARGRLKASGQLRGPRTAPRLTLDLSGAGMALAAYQLKDVRGTADLDLAPEGRFVLNLSGRDLRTNGQRWTAFDLRGTGQRTDHQLTATLSGAPLTLKLDASGALAADGSYRGRLTRLNLDAKTHGKWSLQQPLALERSGERLTLGPFCVQQSANKSRPTSGCVSFAQTASGRWRTELDIDRLDLALLRDYLPPTVRTEGTGRISGQFTANGAVLTGSAIAEIPRGRLRLDLGQGQSQELDISRTRLALDASGAGLAARLALPLGELGRVQGDLQLAAWRLDAPTRPTQPLAGTLRATIPDLRPLASFAPDLSDLRGQAQADVRLSGTLAQPGISGRVDIESVHFQLPLLALRVDALHLHALAPTSDRFELNGAATLGGGTVTLTGHGRSGANPAIQVQLAGQRLTLADTRDYFVRLTPQIEIAATPSGATVRGEVQIPEARIRPRSLPAGTVAPSPDVVLKPSPPRSHYPLTLDLRLVLGEDVTLDSFGVRGRLAGALSVQQAPGRELVGDGQLQITEGQYRLSSGLGIAAELGAPLTITQGRLIYAKSPLNNPGLLLQAERDGGDLTAGVRVVGTLRHPKLTFFSESDPGLTQADITKYLMTGIPPSANDRTDNAGLAIGTYIAPKIYLEYESGLSDESNKVKLRYDLSKHIELQTETGETQGADIFFKFEH